MLKYIRYFFYLATNWNPRIAWHIVTHDIRGEKKYGIHTTAVDELKKLEASGVNIDNSSIYMPASYDMLETLLELAGQNNCRHLLDLGCGMGRALCVAAHYGFTQLTGIDISKPLLEVAEDNLKKTETKLQPPPAWNLHLSDAFYFEIPDSVDCLFLFNPFNDVIMNSVAENVRLSLTRKPRTFFILYKNPLHKEYFTRMGFAEIFHQQKLTYLEGSVLVI